MTRPFFWLHIKKSAGQSTRKALSPHYVEVERRNPPLAFAEARIEQYNDILNNYRTDLGAYQFRRTLYARDVLYRERWRERVSFAFCREPVDRALSTFFYLYYGRTREDRRARWLFALRHGRLALSTAAAFDAFLDMIAEARASVDPKKPYGLHFSTHTAAVWDDVTDREGHVLLDHLFRLEDFSAGINAVLAECDLPPKPPEAIPHVNRSRRRDFAPTKAQIGKIERLYGGDFDLYEGCAKTC